MKKHTTFVEQLTELYSQKDRHQKMMASSLKNYNIELYKVKRFSPEEILSMYQGIFKKNYRMNESDCEQYWFQNQLKVFIWTLIAFLYHNKKTINELTPKQWQIFSCAFNNRPQQFFQFQARFILNPTKSQKIWQPEQSQLLQSIITNQNINNKWNHVARQLFNLSEKKFFKTPKQCRQRWLNHLDPTKKRSGWSTEQDLKLLNLIKTHGKRWALIAKLFDNTRTEHMIKNRFKSIIHSHSKGNKIKEEQIVDSLLKNLSLENKKQSKNRKRVIKIEKSGQSQDEFQPIRRSTLRSRPQSNSRASQQSPNESISPSQLKNLSKVLPVLQQQTVQKHAFAQVRNIYSSTQYFQATNLPFFQEISSQSLNIPFLLNHNQDLQSFISECIKPTIKQNFLEEEVFDKVQQMIQE